MTAWTSGKATLSVRLGLCAAALALPLVACGPDDAVVAYCEERCDCQGCTDTELEDCQAKYEGAIDFAAVFDCEEEYIAELECRTEEGRCENDPSGDYFTLSCTMDPVTALLSCPCDSKSDKYSRCFEKASKADSSLIDD